ncbi:nitroreductase family deazaflavin-dependent oxidoreductase [Microbacterium sp. CBS5P-1]|nr:nitroreductase family deazaflavin-dependent oxidoreductase [Microbacterium excoecariae]
MQDRNERIIEEFRAHDGTVATGGFGRNLVLLHHVGARSGAERVTPVMALRPGEGVWLIAASKAGAPEQPAWFHNLLAHPEVLIEEPGRGTIAVIAEALEGAQRDQAWRLFTEASDAFLGYEKRTDRVIPVFVLRIREP